LHFQLIFCVVILLVASATTKRMYVPYSNTNVVLEQQIWIWKQNTHCIYRHK